MADYPALRAEIDKARGLAHALQQDTQTHSAAVLSQSRADAIGNALLDMCAMAASSLTRDKEGASGGRWEYVEELHRRLVTARNALEDEQAKSKRLREELRAAREEAERRAAEEPGGPRWQHVDELQRTLDGQRDARVHAEKRAKDLKGLLFRSEQDLEVERAESKRLREELRAARGRDQQRLAPLEGAPQTAQAERGWGLDRIVKLQAERDDARKQRETMQEAYNRMHDELREYQKAAQQVYNRMHNELREYRKAAQLTAALPYRGGKKP